MSSLCELWGKGALARDAVPAPVTTHWKSQRPPLPPRKARVLKRAIRVCLVAERRKERLDLEKQRQEAAAKGLTLQDLESKDNVHLKIVQHEERLEELQKEKHKLFLTLKKVLLNEKKQQTAAAPAKKAPEPSRGQGTTGGGMRPRMDEEWGYGRPSMAGAPRMYVPAAYGPAAGMRQTPSMLQQFGGYGGGGQPPPQQQPPQQQQQQSQPQVSPQTHAPQPARPSMLHSGPRDFAFGRGGGRGGMGRGRGQFAASGPAWRYQEAKRGGRGGAYRKDGYYGTPGRM